jgi:hypothetical protein
MIIPRQKLYAILSDEGEVVMTEKKALDLARSAGHKGKKAIEAARKLIEKEKSERNNFEKGRKNFMSNVDRPTRKRIGFVKDEIRGGSIYEKVIPEVRTKIGFRPDYFDVPKTEVPLGFRKK